MMVTSNLYMSLFKPTFLDAVDKRKQHLNDGTETQQKKTLTFSGMNLWGKGGFATFSCFKGA